MEFPKLDVSGSIPVSCTFISWPTRDNEDHEEGPLDARGRSRFAISRLNAITDRFAKWARVWMIDLCLIHVKITGVTILCLTLPSVASGQTVASPSISVAFPTAPIKLDGWAAFTMAGGGGSPLTCDSPGTAATGRLGLPSTRTLRRCVKRISCSA